MSRSINPMCSFVRPQGETYHGFAPVPLIVWMSLRPAIPWRVALLHSSPPLYRPESILNPPAETVNHHLSGAEEFSTGDLGNFQPALTVLRKEVFSIGAGPRPGRAAVSDSERPRAAGQPGRVGAMREDRTGGNGRHALPLGRLWLRFEFGFGLNCDGPDKAQQLTTHSRHDLGFLLAGRRQFLVACVQPPLCFPGDVLHLLIQPLLPLQQEATDP